MISLRSIVALAALSLPSLAHAEAWKIDPAHSTSTFKIRHLMVTNVSGSFGPPTGTVDIDDKDITKSTVTAEVEAAKIDTGIEKRDEHLRSADFFDVKKHPKITFKSKSVAKAGDGLKVTGDLTMHGVTKEVVFDVEGPTAPIKGMQGNLVRGLSATTKINRKDFGLTWNKAIEGGGVVVGEDVAITIDLELHSDKKPAH